VAWIAERKDVLSTFFWILAMWAYLRYVKQPNIIRYLLTLLIFALGLMAKPMLVTLPFVFLLLDYWPLERKISRRLLVSAGRLTAEKIPFIVLSIASSIIAFLTQQSGGSIFAALPLKFRICNALISYMKYIEKLFRPSRLAVFYPYPYETVSVSYAVISAILLLVVTILVIRFAKNHRYLATGWFWYLGTLIPVIGIIQVGSHAYADRYTYVPYIGLFLMLAWGMPQLLSKLIYRKIALGLSMILVLTTLGICAHRQTSYWKNSFTLFSHAIEVTQNNYFAYNNLGNAYTRLGRYEEAIEAYKQAIKINPNSTEACTNLGIVYNELGRYQEAIDVHKQAIKIKPDYAKAHYNLGIAYTGLDRWPEAIETFKQAIKIKPDYAEAYYNLGVAYTGLDRWSEAIDAYLQTIKIDPNYAKAYNNLGAVYINLSRWSEAIETFKQAIKIKPDYEGAYLNLGVAYLAIGDKNSAMAEYNILKSLNPQSANDLLKEINK
jgi:tetratricopeptide (TPR) repeat protein